MDAVLRHRQITSAARELACSPAYIHAALNHAGMTLEDILGADTVDSIISDENGVNTE